MVFRELTMDDMKDKLTTTGSLFDVLLATAGRAKEIYDADVERQKIETLPPKKKKTVVVSRERMVTLTPAAPRFPHHAGSSSSASKKRKKQNRPPPAKKGKKGPPPGKKVYNGPSTPPPLPEEVRRAIEERARGSRGFTAPELVIQKGLHRTDLSFTHNRLSIPMSMIRADFLKEEEKRYLQRYEGINKKFKEVMVVEPSLAVQTAKICRWDMPKTGGGRTSSAYVINGTWNAVARRNNLKPLDVVQLWSFRLDEQLCFALVTLPPQNHTSTSTSTSTSSAPT